MAEPVLRATTTSRDMHVACLLCVEPDEEARSLLHEVLSEYRIVLARNAYEAIRDVHTGSFDAYVLESWLPDWSGDGLCRTIRKLDPHGPVLFCTGAARDQDRTRAFRAGASSYLCKPLNPPDLLNRLRVLLELADLESTRARSEVDRVIQEELTRRAGQILKRKALTRQLAARTIERTCRTKAFEAFAHAGGTLAHFQRYWSRSFTGAWRAYDQLDDGCCLQPRDSKVLPSMFAARKIDD